jgi:hypothetical protein
MFTIIQVSRQFKVITKLIYGSNTYGEEQNEINKFAIF